MQLQLPGFDKKIDPFFGVEILRLSMATFFHPL